MNNKWKISKSEALKIIIPLLLIAGFVLWRMLDSTTGAQLILMNIKKEQFHGKIDSVYRDKWDHNTKKVKLTTGYIYGLYPEWVSKVGIGDSLSKQEGSAIVEVFKLNGAKINLDYRELVKDFKN
jgi:hypothetical protein